MNILNFPEEITLKIVEATIPETIESIALTCRALHRISAPFLAEHNQLRRRYKNFTYSFLASLDWWGRVSELEMDPVTKETGIQIANAAQLLQAIGTEPLIARYIQTADLTKENMLNTYKGRDDKSILCKLEPDSPLRHLLRDSPYLREAGISIDSWPSECSHPFIDSIVLLTLLPNVEKILLPWWMKEGPFQEMDRDEHFRNLLHTIRRRAYSGDPGASLSKLAVRPHFQGTELHLLWKRKSD